LLREIISHSPEETQQIGRELGKLAQAGDIFLLVGGLGTGKTCLTQGIAWGLGVEGYASSPSFVIVKEYQGRLPLYHIDLYRLDKIEEVMELGLEDYLYSGGVCVVEWAEKGLKAFPEQYLLIRLDFLSTTNAPDYQGRLTDVGQPTLRSLRFEPEGEHYLNLALKLCKSL